MIIHIFNSSVVSGPETLVLPQIKAVSDKVVVIFLIETRKEDGCRAVARYARSLGLATHEISVRSRYDAQAVASLARVISELQPSIVHAHDFKASTYTLKASKLTARNFALFSTHHGVRGRPGWKAKVYEKIYTKFVLPHFDRVLTVCSSDRDSLLQRGIKAAQVEIHRNGVDKLRVVGSERQQLQTKIRQEWRRAGLSLDQAELLIGYVGRLSPEKRPERLINVAQGLLCKHPELPPWKIVLFGSGPMEQELLEKIKKHRLEYNVLLAGYREGIGSELAGFDLIVSLSDAEGTPITLVEAGWAQTPVVATAVDGVCDLIDTGVHGELVDPKDSDEEIAAHVAKLLDDAALRRELGERFSEHVRSHFSGSSWVERLKSLYSETKPDSFTKNRGGDNITSFEI